MITIRHYRNEDREAVRRISCETAFLGLGKQQFVEDAEILADVLTRYFTDCEPQSCLVAVSEGRVVGYLTGAQDSRRMNRIFRFRLLPVIAARIIARGVLFQRGSRRFLSNVFVSLCRGEFEAPDFSAEYPALLHINVEERFRGMSIGRLLIRTYLDFLREQGIKGVHLGTLSDSSREFFTKMGFKVLFSGKRSYLAYVLGKVVPYYVMGMPVSQ